MAGQAVTQHPDTRTVSPGGAPHGIIRVPGDKSISHRAALFNAIADGSSEVRNFLPGEDCLATLSCLRALGVRISPIDTLDGLTPPLGRQGSSGRRGSTRRSQPLPPTPGTAWRIEGVGLHGLEEPSEILDVGNSGTSIRLLLGLLAGLDGFAVLTGDPSIRRRPMGRVVRPLREMGLRIDGRSGGERAPLAVRGGAIRGIAYESPVASAQVKSALLLAALQADGETRFREPALSRDHTERMLAAMGARLTILDDEIVLLGGQSLEARSAVIPGDLSSAAFWLVAGAIVPGSDLLLEGVGLNPTRTGILDALRELGAELEVHNEADEAGEPVGDVRVGPARLRCACVSGNLLVRAIDEVPILALAMACAEGRSEIRDATELRVKESDRLGAVARVLGALGARIEERPDGLVIEGPTRWRGGEVDSQGDHRIAMMAAIAALLADGPVTIHGTTSTETSYPGFWSTLARFTEIAASPAEHVRASSH